MNKLILRESELVSLMVSTIKDAQKALYEQKQTYDWTKKNYTYKWPNGAIETELEYDNRLVQWSESSEFTAQHANDCNWKHPKNVRGIHQYMLDNGAISDSDFLSMDYQVHNQEGQRSRWNDDVDSDNYGTPIGTPQNHWWFSPCKYIGGALGNVCFGCDNSEPKASTEGWLCIDRLLQAAGRPKSGLSNGGKESSSLETDMILLIQLECLNNIARNTLPSPPPPPPKEVKASDLGTLSYNTERKKWEYVDSDGSTTDAEVYSGEKAPDWFDKIMDFTDNLFPSSNFLETMSFMSTNPILEAFIKALIWLGEPVYNAVANGLKWVHDYCKGNGWYCVEIVASAVGLVLSVIAIFATETVLLLGAIAFAGAVTVVAMWEQGKKGWALAVGVLEIFGIFRLFRLLKLRGFFSFLGGSGSVLGSSRILTKVLKYFEEPTQLAYSKLGPEVRAGVDYIMKFPKDAIKHLKNSGKVDEAIDMMAKIKNWKMFQVFSKTNVWLTIPSLRSIKTWSDFVKFREAVGDLASYLYKIQKGINMAVTVFKWTVGLGLAGVAGLITWNKFSNAFTEKQQKAFKRLEDDYNLNFNQEDDFKCLFDAYVLVLNKDCNPEWSKYLKEAVKSPEEETTESRFEWFITDLMYRKGTTNINDIHEEIFGVIKKYATSSDECIEGDEIAAHLANCTQTSKDERRESSFDAKKVAKDLMKTMEGWGDTDEENFWLLTYKCDTKQKKLDVRQAFKDMGECLCDWIEGDFDFGEQEALEAWGMYEEGIVNNCTCY